MRSRAVLFGHPLHPMLVPFPFAFLGGAFFFDAAGWLRDVPPWWMTGRYLGMLGVAAGVLAAIPGLIDYAYTVPPNSSAKTRATKHMAVNLSAVALFAAALWIRGNAGQPAVGMVLGLEAIGVALLASGGYMGGTLVTRNMIGVDHRYARAGKWREQEIAPATREPIVIARRDELEIDQMKLLHLGDRRIVLARTKHGYVAFDDRCTHKGGSLAGGVLICGTVQCLWHGSQFDAATGTVSAGPASEPIRTYRVDEHRGEVRLIV